MTKVLSIRQPWAWLIINRHKPIENRDWSEHYPPLTEARRLAHAGAWILIHAGKGMTREEYCDCNELTVRILGSGLPHFDELPRGGIVGEARLTAVVDHHPSPWFFGPVGLMLENATPLVFRPCRGALGFFEDPTDG